MKLPNLGGRSEYFFSFFCSGRAKGESEAPGGGWDRLLIENPRRGGSRRGRGREGVCGELGNFSGGGGQIFFFGAETSSEQIVTDRRWF